MKELISRVVSGFSYAVAINLIVFLVIMLITGNIPMVPGYLAYFENETMAMMVQLFLVGCLSAAFAGGTYLFELPRLGILMQSILFFVITSLVWIPIFGFCFGLFEYTPVLISFSCSYVGTYIICWIVAYKSSKKEVDKINSRLQELKEMRKNKSLA